ncbi:MAG TPA: TylF/MycF/NovP-related O-methyltransferase [Rhizomicrobium sp.]
MNALVRKLTRAARRRLVPPTVPLAALDAVDMPRKIENGRCIYEGYQRGTPLKYGRLADAIWNDPVYRKARAAGLRAPVRTMITEERMMNLFLIVKFFLRGLASRNVIEFGTYRGGGAIFLAMLLREFYPEARVYALDTFEGMPAVEKGLDLPPPDDFAATNLAVIDRTVKALGLTNIEFVKGLIEDTASGVYARAGAIGLAHIDVVLHSAVVYVQNSVWDVMTPGGYVVYDDAIEPTCPGAMQAVEELVRSKHASAEQVWPQMVFRAHLGAASHQVH